MFTNIEAIINNAVKQKEQEIAQIAEDTMWAVLNRNKSYYTRQLRSFVDQLYYGQFAPSDSYDRTGMFKNSAYCKPYREGKIMGLEIGFDTNKLYFVFPSVKGNYASYGSFVPKEKGGGYEALSEAGKEWVVDQLEGRAQIIEAFTDWFNDDFNDKFNTLLSQRLSR